LIYLIHWVMCFQLIQNQCVSIGFHSFFELTRENSKYYLFHFKYDHFLHLLLEFIQLICYFPSLFMRFLHSNNHLRVSNPKSFNSIHQFPFSCSHYPLLVSHIPSQTPWAPFRNAQFLRLTFCFLESTYEHPHSLKLYSLRTSKSPLWAL